MRIYRKKAVVAQKDIINSVEISTKNIGIVPDKLLMLVHKRNRQPTDFLKRYLFVFSAEIYIIFKRCFFLSGVAQIQRGYNRARVPVFAKTAVERFESLVFGKSSSISSITAVRAEK